MPAARTGPGTPPPEIHKQSSQSLCAEGEENTVPQRPPPRTWCTTYASTPCHRSACITTPPPVTTKRMHKTSMKHAERLHTSRASTRGKSAHPPHPHRHAHTTEHAGLNELTNAGVTVDGERPALVPWRPEVRATLWLPTRHLKAVAPYV